jgi:hypothetical protein
VEEVPPPPLHHRRQRVRPGDPLHQGRCPELELLAPDPPPPLVGGRSSGPDVAGEPPSKPPERAPRVRQAELAPKEHPRPETTERRSSGGPGKGRELVPALAVEHQRASMRDRQRLSQREDRRVAGAAERALPVQREERLRAVPISTRPCRSARHAAARRPGETGEVGHDEGAGSGPMRRSSSSTSTVHRVSTV